jgi:hypothetical protein
MVFRLFIVIDSPVLIEFPSSWFHAGTFTALELIMPLQRAEVHFLSCQMVVRAYAKSWRAKS